MDPNQNPTIGNVAAPLASIPTAVNAERAGRVSLPGGMLVGPEVKIVITALENPPQRADAVATVVSILSASAVIVKSAGSIASAKSLDFWNMALMLLSTGAICIVSYRYVQSRAQKTPFHDHALNWVKSLPTELDKDAQ